MCSPRFLWPRSSGPFQSKPRWGAPARPASHTPLCGHAQKQTHTEVSSSQRDNLQLHQLKRNINWKLRKRKQRRTNIISAKHFKTNVLFITDILLLWCQIKIFCITATKTIQSIVGRVGIIKIGSIIIYIINPRLHCNELSGKKWCTMKELLSWPWEKHVWRYCCRFWTDKLTLQGHCNRNTQGLQC